jgi:hypothetical protein
MSTRRSAVKALQFGDEVLKRTDVMFYIKAHGGTFGDKSYVEDEDGKLHKTEDVIVKCLQLFTVLNDHSIDNMYDSISFTVASCKQKQFSQINDQSEIKLPKISAQIERDKNFIQQVTVYHSDQEIMPILSKCDKFNFRLPIIVNKEQRASVFPYLTSVQSSSAILLPNQDYICVSRWRI